jgi:hypothetical protein
MQTDIIITIAMQKPLPRAGKGISTVSPAYSGLSQEAV